MKIGLILNTQFVTGENPTAKLRDLEEQVRAARDSGFDSVCISHHYLLTPFQMVQPLTTLARLAPESGSMKLITNLFLLTIHTPTYVAEQVSTMDVLCEGRFIFGVGLGYRPEEFSATGGGGSTDMADIARVLGTDEIATLGPGRRSESRAHGNDESIRLSDLKAHAAELVYLFATPA